MNNIIHIYSIQSRIIWIVLLLINFFNNTSLNGQSSIMFNQLALPTYHYKPLDTVYLKKAAESEIYTPFSINQSNGDISYFSNKTQTIIIYNYKSQKTYSQKLTNIFDTNTVKKVKLLNYSFIDSTNLLLIFDNKATLHFDKAIIWYNLQSHSVVDEFNLEETGILNSVEHPLDSIVKNMSLFTELNFIYDFGPSIHFNKKDSSILIKTFGSNVPYDHINFTKKPLLIKLYPKKRRTKYEIIDISIEELCPQFSSYSLNGAMGNFGLFIPQVVRINDSSIIVGMSFTDKLIQYNIYTHSKLPIYPSLSISKLLNLHFPDSTTNDVSYRFRYLPYIKFNQETKTYYRVVYIPDSLKSQYGISCKNNCIEIEYDFNFKPIGIGLNEKNYLTTFNNLNRFHYGHIYTEDSVSQKYYCIVRYEIDKSQISNPHEFDEGEKLNTISDYLTRVDTSFLSMDTIPVVFLRNVCSACLQKATGFLQLAQTDSRTLPFLFIAPDSATLNEYLHDSNIQLFPSMHVDISNKIFNVMQFNGHFIYLIKSNSSYILKEIKYEELDVFLQQINPELRITGQVCKPVKEY